MKTIVRDQWQTFDVRVTAPSQVSNRIEFKVPENMLTLDEIRFGALKPAASAVEVFGEVGKNFHLGKISLHVNNKESHVIHENVQAFKLADLRRKFGTKKLGYSLDNGSRVQGYYIDSNTTAAGSYPYILRVYMKGKHKVEVSE